MEFRRYLVWIWLAVLAAGVWAAIPASERQALLDLYASTHGDGWIYDTNWLGPPGTEGDWLGVTCNLAGTHVTRLELAGNRLAGTLPASLHRLTELQRLDLGYNELGGAIPATIGQLKYLRALMLGGNRLEGALPASLGCLVRLEQLSLRSNRLQGEIPSTFGNLTRLWDGGAST
jgi:Leucine-rich repeat (LRR) protein